jgi:hypothetical protein
VNSLAWWTLYGLFKPPDLAGALVNAVLQRAGMVGGGEPVDPLRSGGEDATSQGGQVS